LYSVGVEARLQKMIFIHFLAYFQVVF
jgi:hypothetical protein